MTNGLLLLLLSIAMAWECRYAMRHNRIWIAGLSLLLSIGLAVGAVVFVVMA